MSEGREHRRAVQALARTMHRRGIIVHAADAPGWPRPPLIGGRRPDVLGFYPVVGVAVVGEVKRGPEVWACYPQLWVADALAELCPTGACGLFILALTDGWVPDVAVLCDTLRGPRTWVTVWSDVG